MHQNQKSLPQTHLSESEADVEKPVFDVNRQLRERACRLRLNTHARSNTAYLSLYIDGFPNRSLYTLSLATGTASFISAIDSLPLASIAVAIPTPATVNVLGFASLAAFRCRR